MSGKTADISQFCKLEWFKWVVFQDETAPFPDDVLKLGPYLRPIIDISPAITTKILAENRQVLHRSTYKPLNQDESLDKDRSDAQEQFMARVYERLGSWVLPRELEDIGLESTPQYDPYENDTQKSRHFPSQQKSKSPCQRWVTIIQEQRYCCLEGTRCHEDMQWHRVLMPVETLWGEPIQILYSIPECIKLSLLKSYRINHQQYC